MVNVYTKDMGTNMTPEQIRIDCIEVSVYDGLNWADVNLSAFAAECRDNGMDVTISTDADDYDETCDCGDVIHEGRTYRVSVNQRYGEVEAVEVISCQE